MLLLVNKFMVVSYSKEETNIAPKQMCLSLPEGYKEISRRAALGRTPGPLAPGPPEEQVFTTHPRDGAHGFAPSSEWSVTLE